jgi:hypothetical protein
VLSPVTDLLSAASLLFAGVGVVYGTWYPELSTALAKEIPEHKPDRGPTQKALNLALWRRALPLAVFSFVTMVILLPNAVTITADSARNYLSATRVARGYDAAATLYVAVELFALLFAMHLLSLAWRLWMRLRQSTK